MSVASSVVMGLGWGWDHAHEGAAGAASPAAAVADPCPPAVSRGAKPQNPDQNPNTTLAPDWLRLTGPGALADHLADVLLGHFGAVSEVQRGFHFYADQRTFKGGAKLLSGHSTGDSCMVELSGDVCELLGPDLVLKIAAELVALGMKATRLDLCCDYRASSSAPVRLVEAVITWCRSGSLAGAKRWQPFEEFDADGSHVNLGVGIGRRGKDGSGRYVRCYDKGLETGTASRGLWQRWETEFTGDCAEKCLNALVFQHRAGGDWQRVGLAMTFGSVDFLTGDRHQTLDRRERLPAWSRWLRNLATVRLTARRRLSTPDTLKAAAHRMFGPTVRAISEMTGRPWADVLAWMFDPAEVREFSLHAAALRPQVQTLAHRFSPDWGGDLPCIRAERACA